MRSRATLHPMPERCMLSLRPQAGQRLRDLLLDQGVEFPCGGEGSCGQCRVRVLTGAVEATPAMRVCLNEAEISAGWRLGCLAEVSGAETSDVLTLEIAQWQAESAGGAGPILSDSAPVPVEPRAGMGAVVDLGTTTLVVQCVDLASGIVLFTETALNVQSQWGADVMSRIRHELQRPGELGASIRQQVGGMIARASNGQPLQEVLLVGNSAMHHLFCGLPVDALAAAPFRTPYLDAQGFPAAELEWASQVEEPVTFLPNLGGFVGGDLLAGLVAVGLGGRDEAEALLDLGTNGEIALVTGGEILCASTAAGPAFEAANIRHGMRAAPGAIHRVDLVGEMLCAEVLGGGQARGICGSGLVDAVARALDAGMLTSPGRLRLGLSAIALADGVAVTQKDVRELQLAKAAISSGLRLLEQIAGVSARRLHLAGAFGNYLRPASARRIGLLPMGDVDSASRYEIHPAGNSALRGARILLLAPGRRQQRIAALRAKTRHIELAAQPQFQDEFVEALLFPGAAQASLTLP